MRRKFHIVMLKPTHYDDDGYPIQWVRSLMPSNTLAAIKRQNKITEYRDMIQQWRAHGASIPADYILGFPNDRREHVITKAREKATPKAI